MKHILIFSFVFIFGLTVFAQSNNVIDAMVENEVVNLNAGEFSFEKESYDFGTIIEGVKPEFEFKFKNTGKEPIIIKEVKPSCGCTTPEWPKEPVMPGESSAIKATFDSNNRMGRFNKAIRIMSNAKTPTKILYISGEVLLKE